ncbi:MAG: hypothetical protein NXI32_04845 [bacterium]|nr:hypothetical protein [bacterium]
MEYPNQFIGIILILVGCMAVLATGPVGLLIVAIGLFMMFYADHIK